MDIVNYGYKKFYNIDPGLQNWFLTWVGSDFARKLYTRLESKAKTLAYNGYL
jgi:hypothetical protein